MLSTLRLTSFPSKNLPNLQNTCNLSAQQVAAALRPFYFAVHPDRFGKDPEIRLKNEKSLQIFNGYLNDLFPNSSTTIKPVKVQFSIMKNDKLHDVCINLSGKDPHQIVEDALKKLNLDIKNLPKSKSRLNNFYESTTTSGIDEMWRRMKENDIKIRKKKGFYIKPNDLFANLVKNRDLALSKMESYKKLQEHLHDEIEYMKSKLKMKEIIWSINWDQSYMRRCLTNIDQMINHSSKDEKLRILQAMENSSLVFGRGSYICCDGSLQFGADDVPERWQRVCLEAAVRRLESKMFEQLSGYTKELFGGNIEIYNDPKENLLKAIGQLQSIILRISTRSKGEIFEMHRYVKNHVIEIVSVYGELAVTRNGRLQIPSNVDFTALVEFLKSQENVANQRESKNSKPVSENLELLTENVRKLLDLKILTWDSQISPKEFETVLEKLQNVDDSVKNLLHGLSIHISTNPNIFIMSDGKLSVPTDWI